MCTVDSLTKEIKRYIEQITEAQTSFKENSAARAAVGKHLDAMAEQVSAVKAALKDVQNISMQVKILSLNASVEAARAGAAGKGFAVVAAEIRSLSQNTDAAVARIESNITQMNALLQDTVSGMNNAKKIGAQFDKKLDACVQNAQKLRRSALDAEVMI